MTIKGIDSTGQPAGGNVLPPRQVTEAEELEAELIALGTDAPTTAPTLVEPDVEAVPEQVGRPA